MNKKLYTAASAYLSPLTCDSIVSFKITGDLDYNDIWYSEGTIELSDCNRTATWYLDKDSGLEKIDAAIKMLTTCRKEWIKSQKNIQTLNKKDKKAGKA